MPIKNTRPPYLNIYRDRHGKERIYFRRPGFPQTPLPLPLFSDEFWTAYQKCMTTKKPEIGVSGTRPGTINELIVSFYQTPEFRDLRPSSKTTYRGIIERFRDDHGHKRVARLKTKHVKQILQARAGTPAAANNLLRMIRMLMRHAMELEMRPDDPTVGIRKFKIRGGGFKTWDEADIDTYLARHPEGTKEHTALMLLLFTGLRRSDVVRVGPQHISDGYLTIRQVKTDSILSIPVHPRLELALADAPPDALVYLTTSFGKPFTPNGFGNWFRKSVLKAGLDGLTAHGLRKAIARRLAEAGAKPHEIMSVTGHTTLKEVQRYAAAANRKNMAQTAMDKLNK